MSELEAVSPSVAPLYQRGVPTPPPSPPAAMRRSSMSSERGAVAELKARINDQNTLIGSLRSDLTREQLEVKRLKRELEASEEDRLTAVLNNDGDKIAALEVKVDRLELLIRKSQVKIKELNHDLAERRDKEGSLLDQLHEARRCVQQLKHDAIAIQPGLNDSRKQEASLQRGNLGEQPRVPPNAYSQQRETIKQPRHAKHGRAKSSTLEGDRPDRPTVTKRRSPRQAQNGTEWVHKHSKESRKKWINIDFTLTL